MAGSSGSPKLSAQSSTPSMSTIRERPGLTSATGQRHRLAAQGGDHLAGEALGGPRNRIGVDSDRDRECDEVVTADDDQRDPLADARPGVPALEPRLHRRIAMLVGPGLGGLRAGLEPGECAEGARRELIEAELERLIGAIGDDLDRDQAVVGANQGRGTVIVGLPAPRQADRKAAATVDVWLPIRRQLRQLIGPLDWARLRRRLVIVGVATGR